MTNQPWDFVLFIGRLHVLLVHLPIALLLLVAVLEWLARFRRFPHANASTGIILALAAPAAVFTAACGWLLSWSGGYDASLLRWHKWTGIATAVICVLAAWLYRFKWKTPYRVCVFSSVPIVLVASHLGGSLTHGSDYLARYAPAPLRHWLGPSTTRKAQLTSAADPGAKVVFADLIQPVLQRNCVGCHGPEKTKGHLRLDSYEAILKGGENGPVILPGKPLESELLKRVQLPLSSDDHMPPDGKPQPSAAELALLRWWIEAGASTNRTVTELKPPLTIKRIIETDFGAARPPLTGHPAPPATGSTHVTAPLAISAPAGASAINARCPVSGKPIDPSQTLTFDGRLVAFCCADCKAKFQQDPRPFVSRLLASVARQEMPTNAAGDGGESP